MDNSQSLFQSPPPPASNPYKTIALILAGILLLILGATGGYVYATRFALQKPTEQKVVNPTVVPPTQQAQKPAAAMTVSYAKATDEEKVSAKAVIESSVQPKIEVDTLDISPKDKTQIAYVGHDSDWTTMGIYIFDTLTKKSRMVFEKKESITGRGGYYKDMVALNFSPTGEAFTVNKTGTNFPSFFIVDVEGKILYQSDTDLGHAAWVSATNALYIGDDGKIPLVFDTKSQKTTASALPTNFYRLTANTSGDAIVGITEAVAKLECETFDTRVYSYPTGKELKVISNTLVAPKWKDATTISFEKVSECKKNDGESMFEYSPVSVSEEAKL